MMNFTEVSKAISEVSKKSIDMPKFGEGVSSNNIKDFNEADKKLNIEKVKCINEELEGKNHPITEVKYERRIVDDGDGNLKEGVFPQFKSKFTATLSPNEYKSTDSVQFNIANKQLKESVAVNPDLASRFTSQQLKMIEAGKKPKGFTWHHSEETGKLQLVDSKIHASTGHTGGQNIWGGGTQNR